MPITRLPASRATAKASGRSWSSVSPLATRDLNSSVLPLSCSSERASICSSRALIALTVLSMRLTSRSFLLPKIFFNSGANISADSSTLGDGGQRRRPARQPLGCMQRGHSTRKRRREKGELPRTGRMCLTHASTDRSPLYGDDRRQLQAPLLTCCAQPHES